MVTVFQYSGKTFKGDFVVSSRKVFDSRTKSEVQASGRISVLNRLILLPVDSIIQIKGDRYRAMNRNPADNEIYSKYDLTREDRSERTV